MKRDDLRPILSATLTDANGSAVDLSTAASVKFVMRRKGSLAKKIDSAAGTAATTGGVTYTWVSPNTNTEGTYYGEFEVNWGSSVVQTFPVSGYIEIEIVSDLGGVV